jgi:FkbM family methyltransferase
MTVETGPRDSPSVDVPPLTPMSIDVGGTSIRLLVRPGTFDADIVHEVVSTYQIPSLVEELRRKPTVTIFDVGAHIGAFSAIIATLLPRAVVHAFEPAPDNFAVLQENIRHAGLEPRVRATHAAIGGKAGFFATSDIGRSPDARNTGGHSVTGAQVYDSVPSDGRASAGMIPFGVLLDQAGHVDLAKIDCEGSEFEILYSLTPEQLARIDAMVGEIHSCVGFAGTATNGMEWNASALVGYLGRRFEAIRVDHRIETDTAILETFHATNRRPAGGVMQLLRRVTGRVQRG